MTTTPRLVLAVAPFAAVGLLLAGCGGDEAPSDSNTAECAQLWEDAAVSAQAALKLGGPVEEADDAYRVARETCGSSTDDTS